MDLNNNALDGLEEIVMMVAENMLNGLRSGDLHELRIDDISFRPLLENVEELCSILSLKSTLKRFWIYSATMFGPRELTDDEKVAWTTLLATLRGLEIEYIQLYVGGMASIEMVTQALEMLLPKFSGVLDIHMPRHMKSKTAEQEGLLQAIQNHSTRLNQFSLHVTGQTRHSRLSEGSVTEDAIDEGSLINRLAMLDNIGFFALALEDVDEMTEKECDSIIGILSKGPIHCIDFGGNTSFMGNGGQTVAKAIGCSTHLWGLHLLPGFKDTNFDDGSLAKVLKSNYTLIYVNREGNANGGFAGAIASLNAAGRGSVQTDNDASKEDGVEVLIRVRDNLTALFYLLRENPILFFSN